MAHFSENNHPLIIDQSIITSQIDLYNSFRKIVDVCIVVLPPINNSDEQSKSINGIGELISEGVNNLGKKVTLIIIGEIIDLVNIQNKISDNLFYQLWVAIKRKPSISGHNKKLPNQHFGALVYTKYKAAFKHTKTRIEYSYCPVCNKTTKDYGGKKHVYHEKGTLISDVWRDIDCELNNDLSLVYQRFADLLGIEEYKRMDVLQLSMNFFRNELPIENNNSIKENDFPQKLTNTIINGDCIEILKKIPDNSIDFAFLDPPYNLNKKYSGYSDDLDIQEYFQWCDKWIYEVFRILKPGRTIALLNIPIRSIRHFLYLQTIMKFQNWIVWDALAFPVRLIMPSHYSIICFSKGEPRDLPCSTGDSDFIQLKGAPKTFHPFKPLSDGYCLRDNCINVRIKNKINDKNSLTDFWIDIHRLKHNSRRVDHPTQLPPHLMYRIISIFTKPKEIVLDCFNGSGTTTLAAHQLGRGYCGIELSQIYCDLSINRHKEIQNDQDPFRKMDRVLVSKNSPVPRLLKQSYKIPKKTLQLEVKRVAGEIGHIPSRIELEENGVYPIEYYDKYFASWGEVTAAARTTGMIEKRLNNNHDISHQMSLFDNHPENAD